MNTKTKRLDTYPQFFRRKDEPASGEEWIDKEWVVKVNLQRTHLPSTSLYHQSAGKVPSNTTRKERLSEHARKLSKLQSSLCTDEMVRITNPNPHTTLSTHQGTSHP